MAVDDTHELLFDLGKRNDNTENIRLLSARYRKAAMKCFDADNYLWRHTLFTLQALILLVYGINHSHGQSWALLGTTYNIALSLGCHVDPSTFDLTQVETEERRRCWAALTMLYTLQNSSMGVLDSRVLPSDVRAPAVVNDIDLLPGGKPQPDGRPSQISYLLHKLHLYSLSSDICQRLFGPRQPSYQDIMELDKAIACEQDKWNAKIYLPRTNGAIANLSLRTSQCFVWILTSTFSALTSSHLQSNHISDDGRIYQFSESVCQ